MKGSDFVLGLPASGSSSKRDEQIVAAVADSMYAPLNWTPVRLSANGREATIFVMPDALMIGEPGDYVRISMNADTAQRVAWELNSYLPTTKICDAVWDAAKIQIKPCVQSPPDYDYAHMDAPERILDYHVQLNRSIAAANARQPGASVPPADPGDLIGNIGKDWVLTNKNLDSDRVRNYGWYVDRGWSVSASGRRMIQTLGAAHNSRHVDYSQVLRLVKNEVIVDGQTFEFNEVARDPELCWLVSSEGVLKSLSIPAASKWYPAINDLLDEEPDESTPSNTPGSRPSAEMVRQLVYKRTLYLSCAPADDVGEWQAFLKVTVDNQFGRQTDAVTRQFQRENDLVMDGRVGPKTIAKANELIAALDDTRHDLELVTPGVLDLSTIRFKQARNYTVASRERGDVKWIVIHSMESAEKPTAAEAVASWFAGPDAPKASAHFNVDDDSIVQSVRTEHIAWHAPGANRHGIGIEHAGRARQTREDWLDDFSQEMLLKQSIPLCAALCKLWQVPATFVTSQLLQQGISGITTHHEVSRAFRKSDHWDPGPNFPMKWYLKNVTKVLA